MVEDVFGHAAIVIGFVIMVVAFVIVGSTAASAAPPIVRFPVPDFNGQSAGPTGVAALDQMATSGLPSSTRTRSGG